MKLKNETPALAAQRDAMITGLLTLIYVIFGVKKADRKWWYWTLILTLPITVGVLASVDLLSWWAVAKQLKHTV